MSAETKAEIPAAPAVPLEGVVSTLAGTGRSGRNNGVICSLIASSSDTPPTTSTSTTSCGSNDGIKNMIAQFNRPQGIAIDAHGNLWIADTANHMIRKISVDGHVTTVAGTGRMGYVNGSLATSQFRFPSGIAVSLDGQIIYVADFGNHVVRRLSIIDNVVSTYAGDGRERFMDGDADHASFRHPSALSLYHKTGDLYVADFDNERVRVIDVNRGVRTVAGCGMANYQDGGGNTGIDVGFNNIRGIVIDQQTGVLYIADTGNMRVRKMIPDGTVTTISGGWFHEFADGELSKASFREPTGIAIDRDGSLYIADFQNHRIRRVTSDEVSTIAGGDEAGNVSGFGSEARFNHPYGIVLAPSPSSSSTKGGTNVVSSPTIYIADQGSHSIKKITFTIARDWKASSSTTTIE